jgi:hypothetical protein
MFNGIEHSNVITADEDEGEIVTYKIDANGEPVLGSWGNLAIETLRGHVRIVWPIGQPSFLLKHKAQCKLDRFSSRVCERGTKSCTVTHPT